MKKYQLDLIVTSIEHLNEKYVLIKLTDEKPLPAMLPGQFVNIRIDNADTFLRRPISINLLDTEKNELHLLVAAIGEGTKWLATRKEGDNINILLPLGNGFSAAENMQKEKAVLLVGGGVGVAPLLYYGKALKENGITPVFLLGARTANDLLLLDSFKAIGDTYVTTEDATLGDKGFVTNSAFLNGNLA
ncbi:MAG: dihydroorotate dehydrogenase electron transfer subunit, partial [Prevotella sp.]|nr:dihydroorotate dehydrogenase electron transfer subunit [Prevotella sp.]